MAFTIQFHKSVFSDDLCGLPNNIQQKIIRAIDERLSVNPSGYGSRLAKSLAGYWKLRVGDYRVVFAIARDTVTVLAIGHRKGIYKIAAKRLRV